jgi:hypothetical protein
MDMEHTPTACPNCKDSRSNANSLGRSLHAAGCSFRRRRILRNLLLPRSLCSMYLAVLGALRFHIMDKGRTIAGFFLALHKWPG